MSNYEQKQDRQYKHNVSKKLIRATIFTVRKQ